MHPHTLEEVDATKYLGLTFHQNLSLNTHIDTVLKKANNTRAFLHRNFRGCPRDTKAMAYKLLVRPLVE